MSKVVSVNVKKEKKEEEKRKAEETKEEVNTKGEGKGNGKTKKESNKKTKKISRKTEENFEPIDRWWEKIDSQGDVQWKYLEHRGVIFAPPYVPHNIPILYKGSKIALNPQSEELATYWCTVIGSEYCTKGKFILNFFTTFVNSLEKENIIRQENEAKVKRKDISNFQFLDFMPIKDHLMKLREERLKKTKEEKEEDKKIRMEKELPYTYALVDWIREKISSTKVEPPGLFRGRGEHPKQGLLKKRIFPEDVVINISKDAPVPKLQDDMSGHNWGDIYHDNKVTWLSYYKDSINDQIKYTFLSAQSKFKGYKDLLKYENARKLKSCVDSIRKDYKNKMCQKSIVSKQLGTAVYLIDFLALRVGGEKDIDEEADTVGCCSLRVEHVSFNHDVPLKNTFSGKSSKKGLEKNDRAIKNSTWTTVNETTENAFVKGEMCSGNVEETCQNSGNKYQYENGSNTLSHQNRNMDPSFPSTSAMNTENKKCADKKIGKLPLPVSLDDIKEEDCYLTLDFLGKDSIRYFNTVKVDKRAYINMILFCKNKNKDEGVFDQINCAKLNDYLKEIMPTLSAKVFRTYNASITLDQQLKRIKPVYGKLDNLLLAYETEFISNKKRKVQPESFINDVSNNNNGYAETTGNSADPILENCNTGNHPSNNNNKDKDKDKDNVDSNEYLTNQHNKDIKNGEKDKNSPIEVDVTDINALINFYNNANREVAILCNHQRSIPKQHVTTMSKIKKQIELLKEDIKEYTEYLRHLRKHSDKPFVFVSTVEALDGSLRPNKVKDNMKEEVCKKKLVAVIKKVELLENQMKIRDDNKTIALGTSKINYMDPRITVAFCKRFEIPIEKIFNRSLRLKFPWAMFVQKDFCF